MNTNGLVDAKSGVRRLGAVVVTWGEFERAQPGRSRPGAVVPVRGGLTFLATVGRDGGPRAHPMCPFIHSGGLYAFIVPGPKQADLHRDGRYSLHSFPCEDNKDAFYCTGHAQAIDDPATRQPLAELFVTERSTPGVPAPAADDHLFHFWLPTLPAHPDNRPRRPKPAAHHLARSQYVADTRDLRPDADDDRRSAPHLPNR
jgi:hypothetical protein